MEWKPIDSAPKDGSRILVFCPIDGAITVIWEFGQWQLDPDGGTEFSYDLVSQPTHWMPLPAPPPAEPKKFMGMSVKADPKLPPQYIALKSEDGRLLTIEKLTTE